MKRSMTCPKCQHRKLWVVPEVALARNISVPLPTDIAEMFAKKAPAGTPMTARKEDNVHGLEAYVCAQCGYSEMWATSLEYVAKVGTFVDGEAGPYR
jgi:predicted nucleic-acid-binding Zn-ribbon protein